MNKENHTHRRVRLSFRIFFVAVNSQFTSSKSTKGWGSYAKKSPAEFYSDAVAKSVLGGSDKWTKALGKIK